MTYLEAIKQYTADSNDMQKLAKTIRERAETFKKVKSLYLIGAGLVISNVFITYSNMTGSLTKLAATALIIACTACAGSFMIYDPARYRNSRKMLEIAQEDSGEVKKE